MDRLSAKAMGEGLAKQSVLVETIGGLETVKAAGAGPLLAERWDEAMEKHSRQLAAPAADRQHRHHHRRPRRGTISYAGVVIVGVGMIANQTLTMGGLIACSILAGRAVAPLAQISQLLSRMTATRTAYRQLNEMMNMPPEGPEGEALKLAGLKGRIEFRNVSFRYPGAAEKTLEELNFTIEPGEHVALLGRVGSGKSTIARLILGLYPPEEGLVMIDGTDIRQLDPLELRAQHRHRAAGERAADRLGAREYRARPRRHVDDEEMLRAVRAFRHPPVHGPDRQRLRPAGSPTAARACRAASASRSRIARALAGRPPVLVFDEPTSAMDAQTETALIQRLAGGARRAAPSSLITHRPPLLALVSRIMLIDRGKVVADGPRDEVLKQITRQQTPPDQGGLSA